MFRVSHSVSRVSQFNCNPTMGTVKVLKVIAGYLKGSIDFRAGGTRLLNLNDQFNIFTDSDHHGDKLMTSKSQTGVMVLLNGIPIHWRSNTQPKTADSPACVETYALNTLTIARITGFAQLSRIFNFYLAGLLHRP